jgi:hypothetical protein
MSDSKKKPQQKNPKKAPAKKAPAKKAAAKKAPAKKAPAKKAPAKKAPAKPKQSVKSSFDSVDAVEAHEMAHQMMAALDAQESIKVDFLDDPQEVFAVWDVPEVAPAVEAAKANASKPIKVSRIKRFFRLFLKKSTK